MLGIEDAVDASMARMLCWLVLRFLFHKEHDLGLKENQDPDWILAFEFNFLNTKVNTQPYLVGRIISRRSPAFFRVLNAPFLLIVFIPFAERVRVIDF
jgi:hypothetical protein